MPNSTKQAKRAYDPQSTEPFKLSRSKIDLFCECPRCFYLDRRLGIQRPPGFPFTLNNAVDTLLKKEFDTYREQQKPHPLMIKFGINAVPFRHDSLDTWRDALHGGIQYHDPASNLLITGGIDDVWVKPDGELIIVDYKATSKSAGIGQLLPSYMRQMEIYQWLFRKNGFTVDSNGVFVYCNANKGLDALNGVLTFDISFISHPGNADWIEPCLQKIHQCLASDKRPEAAEGCKYCGYVTAILAL